jgi:hypothetical protein
LKNQEVKFGRFKFEQCFVFPKDVTHFIEYTCLRLKIDEKSLCHVFCGKSLIGGLRIDKDKSVNPNIVADCLDLPNILGENSQKHILADFPWVIDYNSRRKYSYTLRDICKKDGYLILNCPWSPWVDGLELVEVWKVSQCFNSYRDLVDFWILRKL